MKKLFKFVPVTLFLLFPVLSFAFTYTGSGNTSTQQTCDGITGLSNIICNIQLLLNSIVPLLVGLGIVYFVWGVVQYVIAGGEEAKTKGRDRIIYGIIGLTAIVGMWGLVNIVVNTFNIGGTTVPVPTLVSTTTGAASTGAGTTCDAPTNIQTFLGFFTCLINNAAIPLIFAIAIVMFIWGVVSFFIINADEEKKRAQGKQFMIWGIIALAVMLSVWGLVSMLGTSFGIKGGSVLPQVTPPK